jgi:hypothetical protein
MADTRLKIAETLGDLKKRLGLVIGDEKMFEEILKEERHQKILDVVKPLATHIQNLRLKIRW